MLDPNGPASRRQKEFAQNLGIEFDADVTAGVLGLEITKVRRDQPPSEGQVSFAMRLGIEFDETTIKGWELKKLLTTEVAKQSRAALKANPVLKVGETVMYKDHAYHIDQINTKLWKVKLTPCHKGHGKTVWVMVLTLRDAEHVNVLNPQRQAG